MQTSLPSIESGAAYPVEFPPLWASVWGEDQAGLYADLLIHRSKGLLQRFRWISPGEFMMGSPEDEAERDNDEDYHRVALTKGYWLADTTVIQAVWLAVRGDNPSNFKGERNPVEQVSWDDVQIFIKQLNKNLGSILGDSQIRLPTEAEWEHACRAGTETPFSFGKNINPEQVNYDGEFPYADGEQGLNRKRTVPVKSLPANVWGLYEMHGNVWEWCADAWLEHLGTEAVADPHQAEGSERVVRGGSWIRSGWNVRSACRNRYSPGYRYDYFGFRLSLGQVSSSRGSAR